MAILNSNSPEQHQVDNEEEEEEEQMPLVLNDTSLAHTITVEDDDETVQQANTTTPTALRASSYSHIIPEARGLTWRDEYFDVHLTDTEHLIVAFDIARYHVALYYSRLSATCIILLLFLLVSCGTIFLKRRFETTYQIMSSSERLATSPYDIYAALLASILVYVLIFLIQEIEDYKEKAKNLHVALAMDGILIAYENTDATEKLLKIPYTDVQDCKSTLPLLKTCLVASNNGSSTEALVLTITTSTITHVCHGIIHCQAMIDLVLAMKRRRPTITEEEQCPIIDMPTATPVLISDNDDTIPTTIIATASTLDVC